MRKKKIKKTAALLTVFVMLAVSVILELPEFQQSETVAAAEVETDGITGAIYYGDVNEDGKIKANDALLVLQHCVNMTVLTDRAFALADMNLDGEIGANDALWILQVCVSLREVTEYREEDPGLYSISDLRVEDNIIYVTVNTEGVCTCEVLIAGQDVTGAPLEYTATAAGGLEMTELQIQIDQALPEYFTAYASLYDADSKLLCSYTCKTYTKEYELFQAQTTEDFSKELVINFDEDTTTNFGVLSENVKRIESTDIENGITENADGTFLFTNADSVLCNLQVGDEIAVFRADEEPILISVASIMCEGDTVLITPAENTELQEYYQVLKIDMVLDNTDAIIEPAPGVTIDEAAYASAEKQISQLENTLYLNEKSYGIGSEAGGTIETKEFTFSKLYEGKSGKASAVAGLSFSLEFQLSFDVHLFSASYIELRCVLGTNGYADVNVEIEMKNEPETAEIALGNITFPTEIPGLVISAPLTLSVVWSMEANADFHAGIEMSIGFSFNTSSGFQKLCKKSLDTSADVGGKFSFKGGPAIALQVSLMKEIVSAQIGCHCGISLDGDVTTGLTQQSGDAKHVCGLCIEGDANAFVKSTAKFSYHITDRLQGTPYDDMLVDWTNRLGTFSYSILNESDSPLGGESHFYLHACENRKYKTTVTVVDQEGKEIPEASVTVKDGDKTAAEFKSGESVYLYPDTYLFCATDGANVSEISAVVEKNANEIRIIIEPEITEKPLELTEIYATQVIQFTHGDPWTEITEAQNPLNVLGVPDHANDQNGLTLGGGGVLIVSFDRAFKDIEGADITVYEAGDDKESVEVSVSADGEIWYTVGTADGGTSKIDISGAVPEQIYFQYVRLTDMKTALNSRWPGADIDAISVQVYQD